VGQGDSGGQHQSGVRAGIGPCSREIPFREPGRFGSWAERLGVSIFDPLTP
jgi:hypothetical protein